MSHITTSQASDQIKNNGSWFSDPLTDATFFIKYGHHFFHITTVINGVPRHHGVVAWSEQLQAFVGEGWNIPMSWKI
jgi:hypothetical protein